MNICVCMKQVPDTNEIKVDPVTHTLIRKGVPSIVNPFDTYAQEVGVRLKEASGGKLIVVSMGPEQAKEAIKSCLAVGADGGYLISSRNFGGSDTLATSYILSEAIKAIEEKEGLKFDLILCGKQATDGDTAQVGPEIAEHLGLPQITYALEAKLTENGLEVIKEGEDENQRLSISLPCLLTFTEPAFDPRYPTLKRKLAANRAEIPVLGEDDFPEIDKSRIGLKGSPTRVKSTFVPPKKQGGVKIQEESDKASAQRLFSLLSEAHIIE